MLSLGHEPRPLYGERRWIHWSMLALNTCLVLTNKLVWYFSEWHASSYICLINLCYRSLLLTNGQFTIKMSNIKFTDVWIWSADFHCLYQLIYIYFPRIPFVCSSLLKSINDFQKHDSTSNRYRWHFLLKCKFHIFTQYFCSL